MGLTGATLNDRRATRARVSVPAWGCWYADVELDGEHTLTGSVTLKIADLTLKGAVISGGPSKGRSQYNLVAGAGGWGRSLPKKDYADDAGVKLSRVLTDAARSVGESFGTLPSTRVGPHWVRPRGRASSSLNLLARDAWYVDNDGVTQLGARTAGTLPAKATRVQPVDLARGKVVLASESIAAIMPGVVVDGLTAVDVQHEISSKGGLRSTVYGARAGSSSREFAAFRALLENLDPDRAFRAVYEYRVVTQSGDRLNLQPVLVSTGMPDLQRVVVRPGVSGAKSTVALGSRVLVGFVNADPARPYVASFEDPEGDGFTPILTSIDASTFVKLGAGVKPAIAAGDMAGIFPCVPTQVKVLI